MTNDSYINPRDLGVEAMVVVQADLRGASREVEEPAHSGRYDRFTVWYQWRAPSQGTVQVSASTSEPSEGGDVHAIAYFEGTHLDQLVPFNGSVEAGQTIRIAVSAPSPVAFALQLEFIATTQVGFRNWITEQFPDSPELHSVLADPDYDGIVNGFEYWFGGDPGSSDQMLPEIRIINAAAVLAFRRRQEMGNEFETVLESSNDLTTWSPVDLGTLAIDLTPIEGTPFEAVRLMLPLENAERVFFRWQLRVKE